MKDIKLMVVVEEEARKTDLYSKDENMRPKAIQRLQIYLLTCFYIYQTPFSVYNGNVRLYICIVHSLASHFLGNESRGNEDVKL